MNVLCQSQGIDNTRIAQDDDGEDDQEEFTEAQRALASAGPMPPCFPPPDVAEEEEDHEFVYEGVYPVRTSSSANIAKKRPKPAHTTSSNANKKFMAATPKAGPL